MSFQFETSYRIRQPTDVVPFGMIVSVWILNSICAIYAERDACWENNIVPYKIHTGFTPYQENYIKQQIGKINEKTCIYWTDMNESDYLQNATSYVSFEPHQSYVPCSTAIFWPDESTPLKVRIRITAYCFEEGYVLHEIVHALGFSHEHQRPDRDCYVWVSDRAKGHLDYDISKYFGFPGVGRFPYDKESIMHYPRSDEMKAHSERFYNWEPLGNQEERLTDLDVWKIQYRFCGWPHYCDVYHQHCKDKEMMESETNCAAKTAR